MCLLQITLEWTAPTEGIVTKYSLAEAGGLDVSSAGEPTGLSVSLDLNDGIILAAETCYNFELKSIFQCKGLDGNDDSANVKESSSVYKVACTGELYYFWS